MDYLNASTTREKCSLKINTKQQQQKKAKNHLHNMATQLKYERERGRGS